MALPYGAVLLGISRVGSTRLGMAIGSLPVAHSLFVVDLSPSFTYKSYLIQPHNEGHTVSKQIFINLPVADLKRSKAFYEAIDATNNPAFSDDTAACMVFSDTIYAMLLTHEKWRQFTGKRIVDARVEAQVLLCLSADSREGVTRLVERAIAAGGKADPTPVQDFGFMYGRSFEDPDGHIWEVMWFDSNAAPAHG